MNRSRPLLIDALRAADPAGSAWQLVGPRADFERIGLPDDGVSARIETAGGRVSGTQFSAHLELGNPPIWNGRVDLVAAEGVDAWLLGLPVLRHWHLLLAPDAFGASCMALPPPFARPP